MKKGMLHLFCGKMAAGKTTLSKKVADSENAILISEDIWLQKLYSDKIKDFSDYLNYSQRLKEVIKPHVQNLLINGISVVMDFPGNTVNQRKWLKSIFEEIEAEHIIYFIDLEDKDCLIQLEKRNNEKPEGSMVMSKEDFNYITSFFTPIDTKEGFNVKIIKKHETVEYSKDIATSINEFSAYELDVFLVLVFVSRSKLRHDEVSELENLKLEIPSSTLKKLLCGTHNSRIKKALSNIYDTKIYLKSDKYMKIRHIFESLDYSEDYKNISFELKKEYINLFYNLTGNFTQHKIKEFTSLKSRYAKRIYQIVMSYKGLYKWEFEAKEFRSILDIPDSYGWPDISLKIIKKISKELRDTTNIEDIFLEKIKNGRNIESVILKWKFKVPELLAGSDKNKVLMDICKKFGKV
ncbi:MAG: AAA family ATPase [Cetobacterium sp.]